MARGVLEGGNPSALNRANDWPVLELAYQMTYHRTMPTLSASQARANLYRLIDETAASHEPIVISGKRHEAVLLSGDDWRAIQETLHLLSIPGMRESVLAGMSETVADCAEELNW